MPSLTPSRNGQRASSIDSQRMWWALRPTYCRLGGVSYEGVETIAPGIGATESWKRRQGRRHLRSRIGSPDLEPAEHWMHGRASNLSSLRICLGMARLA